MDSCIVPARNNSTGIAQGVEKATDYVLNVEKSLAKKLQAAKREYNLDIAYKDGGSQIVLTADAVSFELLKESALIYFSNPQEASISRTFDKTGKSVVQYTIRYMSDYTLNVYPTTCRMMVNGKNLSKFVDTDVEKICSIARTGELDGQPLNITQLNKSLVELLEKAQNLNKSSLKKKPNNSRLKRSLTDSNILNGRPIDTIVSNTKADAESIQCIKCKRNCRTNSLYCSQGQHWIHYRCDGLSSELIEEHEKNNNEHFTCSICSDPQIPTSRVSQTVAIPNINQPAIPNRNQVSSSKETHTLVIPNINQISKRKVTQTLAIPNVSPKTCSTNSVAEDILTENTESNFNRSDGSIEIEEVCGVCETQVDRHAIVCEQCQITCHSYCAYLYKEETAICISCFGLYEQNSQDLKLKEVKLKKQEDVLKLREKFVKDKTKDQTRLMTYCEKLESRNNELEQSLKTLTARIEQLEGKSTGDNTHIPAGIASTSPTLLESVHERVTTFILRQVDKQLQLLDETLPQENIQKTVNKNTQLPDATNEINQQAEKQ